jgi:multidrug efflux system membrane fusion protein
MTHDLNPQTNPPRRNVPRRLVLTLLLAAVGGALYAFDPFASESAPSQFAAKVAPPRQPVIVADVVVKPIPVVLSTIGRVQTIKSVAIRSRIDGVIATVSVRDGEDVKAGDPLFQLDDREAKAQLRQAEAALTRAKVELENAQRDLKRISTLVEKSVSSRQQLDQQQANVDALQAQVRENEAAIERARIQLSYTVIEAPIAGRIGTVNVTLGASIDANAAAPLLTINQLRPVYVAFSVPQRYLAELQNALAAGPLTVMASIPGSEIPPQRGTVAFIENAIDAATNMLPVRAAFENAETQLWPAQFVTVVLTLRTEPDAIVVPAEAVQSHQEGSFVFVVTADSTIEMRRVTLMRIVADEAVVEGALRAGESVVTRGQLRLRAGTPVEIKQPQQDAGTSGGAS